MRSPLEVETAIDVLGELGDEGGLARAYMVLSDLLWSQGKASPRRSKRRLGRPIMHAGPAIAARSAGRSGRPPWARSTARCRWPRVWSGSSGCFAGSPENRTLDANLSGFVTLLEAMSGRFDEARLHIKESRALARDLGLIWQAGVQELLSGYVELLAGDPVAAERDMRAAGDVFRDDRRRLVLVDCRGRSAARGLRAGALRRRLRPARSHRRSTRRRPIASGRSSGPASRRGCSPGAVGWRRRSAWRARGWRSPPTASTSACTRTSSSIWRRCCVWPADRKKPRQPRRMPWACTSARGTSPERPGHGIWSARSVRFLAASDLAVMHHGTPLICSQPWPGEQRCRCPRRPRKCRASRRRRRAGRSRRRRAPCRLRRRRAGASLPAPPRMLSLPASPKRPSIPEPPRRSSLPAPPSRPSVPEPPQTVSLPPAGADQCRRRRVRRSRPRRPCPGGCRRRRCR